MRAPLSAAQTSFDDSRSESTLHLLANVGLNQLAWFAVVLGMAWGRPLLGATVGLAAIAAHLAMVTRRCDELWRLSAAVGVGLVIESINAQVGIYQAQSAAVGSVVPWMLVLWAAFATTLEHSMRWLSGRYPLALILGALAGPMAFWGGERLGAIAMSDDPALLALLAVEWALALPLLMAISARISARRRSTPSALGIVATAALVVAAIPAGASASSDLSQKRLDLESNCAAAGNSLSIRGAASYEYLGFIDVMEAAFYDEAPRRAEPVLGPVSKCLVIRYERSFAAEDFRDVTIRGIAQNVSSDDLRRLMPRIERFNRMYRDVTEGDRYSLAYIPGRGTVMSYNGEPRGIIEGNDFAAALFSIWLGRNPMDSELRRELLSGT